MQWRQAQQRRRRAAGNHAYRFGGSLACSVVQWAGTTAYTTLRTNLRRLAGVGRSHYEVLARLGNQAAGGGAGLGSDASWAAITIRIGLLEHIDGAGSTTTAHIDSPAGGIVRSQPVADR